MTMGTGSVNKKAKKEDKGTPKQEVKAAREKSKEKPRSANMSKAGKMKKDCK